MLLSFRKRFLFVANTKTASTSIEAVLRPFADVTQLENSQRKHMPLAQVLGVQADAFDAAGVAPDGVLKFGVMRDPLDWIGSWFRYRRGNPVESPLPADMTFDDFWRAADWNIRRWDGTRNLQRRLFCDPDDSVVADLILPFDRVGSLFARVCAGLDLPPVDLPHENTSNLREIDGMTPALMAEIRDFYAEDYALYHRLDILNAPALARLDAGDFRAD